MQIYRGVGEVCQVFAGQSSKELSRIRQWPSVALGTSARAPIKPVPCRLLGRDGHVGEDCDGQEDASLEVQSKSAVMIRVT